MNRTVAHLKAKGKCFEDGGFLKRIEERGLGIMGEDTQKVRLAAD